MKPIISALLRNRTCAVWLLAADDKLTFFIFALPWNGGTEGCTGYESLSCQP
jgi:hypothetical protein